MREWLIPFLAGAATGVLSGFGVGGGTLLLVYMTAFAGVEQSLAQGINLLYFLPAGLLALPAHLKNGYVEKRALLPAIGAGLVLAALGPGWLQDWRKGSAQVFWGISHLDRTAGTLWPGEKIRLWRERPFTVLFLHQGLAGADVPLQQARWCRRCPAVRC